MATLEMEVLVRCYDVVGAFARRDDMLRALVSAWILTSPPESVDLMVRFFATIVRNQWAPPQRIFDWASGAPWYQPGDHTHTVYTFINAHFKGQWPSTLSFVLCGSSMKLYTMQPNGLSNGEPRDVTFRDLCNHVEPLDDHTMNGLVFLFLDDKIDDVLRLLAFVPIRVQGFEGGVMRTIASFLI